MNRSTSNFPGSEQARNSIVRFKVTVSVILGTEHFAKMIGGDTTHVVVNSGQHRNWFFGNIHTCKNGGSLTDSRQSLSKQVRWKMIQMQVDMILFRSDTASISDFHGHGTTDNITRSQILGRGSITFHETFSFTIAQNSTFSTAAFRNETSSTVNASWMELYELIILITKPLTHGHGIAITSASVCGCARKVGATVSPCGQDCVLGLDTMYGTVFHVHCHYTNTRTVIIHDEIQSKVFNKVGGVEGKRTPIQCVKHGVSSSIGSSRTTMGLSTLSKF
mmetsp:Transcript_5189/g.6776  ORF Transcript_5189/g.6776 Transcript_5189/m.6776 type:complete len:277 (-) Transcript_5189:520-1350(-)